MNENADDYKKNMEQAIDKAALHSSFFAGVLGCFFSSFSEEGITIFYLIPIFCFSIPWNVLGLKILVNLIEKNKGREKWLTSGIVLAGSVYGVAIFLVSMIFALVAGFLAIILSSFSYYLLWGNE